MPFATRFALLLIVLLAACADAPRPAETPASEAAAVPADTLAADVALDGATPAPDFTLPGPEGSFALRAQRGHVVVVVFWATWSELGSRQLDVLAALHPELAAQGAVIVGVAQDENGLRALRPFVAETPLPFALAADSAHAVAARYGRVEMLPTLVVVDREGLVRARHTGLLDRDALLALLGPVLVEGDLPVAAQPASLATPGEVASLPATEARALVAQGAMLVDVRPAEQRAAEGAVPDAAALAADTLRPSDLPANFGVPLVFLGEEADAERAAEQAAAWGYAAVFRVVDGLDGWKAAGLPIAPPAPLPTERTGAVIG